MIEVFGVEGLVLDWLIMEMTDPILLRCKTNLFYLSDY